MRTVSRLFLLATALAVATPLAAQQAAADSSSRTAAPRVATAAAATAAAPDTPLPAVAIGPVIQPYTAGLRIQAATAPHPMMTMAANEGHRRDVVLMIVGGAALITGAVIDGRSGGAIMLAGGLLGLFGLFRYLQ
jgi:hypothetical protein